MAKGIIYGALGAFILVLIFAVTQSSKVAGLEEKLDDAHSLLAHKTASLDDAEDTVRKLRVTYKSLKERSEYTGDNAEKLTAVSAQLDECRVKLDTTERDLQESKADLQELAKESAEAADADSDTDADTKDGAQVDASATGATGDDAKEIEKLSTTMASKLGACIERRNQQATQLIGLQRLLRSISKVEQKVEQVKEQVQDQAENVETQVKDLDNVKQSVDSVETKEKIDKVENKLKDSSTQLKDDTEKLAAAALLFKERVRQAQEKVVEFQKKQGKVWGTKEEEQKEAEDEAAAEEKKQEAEDEREAREEERAIEQVREVTIQPVLKDLKKIVKEAPAEVKERLKKIQEFAKKMDEARRAQAARDAVLEEKREVAKSRLDLLKRQREDLKLQQKVVNVENTSARQKLLDLIEKRKAFQLKQQKSRQRQAKLREKFIAKGVLPAGFGGRNGVALNAVSPLKPSVRSQQQKDVPLHRQQKQQQSWQRNQPQQQEQERWRNKNRQ